MAEETEKKPGFSIVRTLGLLVIVMLLLFGGLIVWGNMKNAKPGDPMKSLAYKNYRSAKAAVLANKEWQQVGGIVVKAGDRVAVTATGRWKVGPNWAENGPEGTNEKSAFGDYRTLNDSKLGSLIAGIGLDAKTGWEIGSKASFIADKTGALCFRINDRDIGNNSGEMSITVEAYEP